MVIDIIFFILMLSAIYKGYSRGFIIAVVSFIAIIIGLAAAVKLSVIVANWLRHTINVGSQWLPFLSFIVIMVSTILLLRLLANVLQKSVELLLMGWANKLGGIFFYAIIYTLIFSVVLFYANKLGTIKAETIAQSKCYYIVEPLGIKMINGFGKIIPTFKDLFIQLESFFGKIQQKIQA